MKFPELAVAFGQQPKTPATLMAGDGGAIGSWRAKFKPRGLQKVISASRLAAKTPPLAKVEESIATLRDRMAKFPEGSIEHVEATASLEKMEKAREDFWGKAQAASADVWKTPEALKLFCDDLRAMVASLDAEIDEAIRGYRAFYKSRGWSEPSPAYIYLACVPFKALNDHAENIRESSAVFERARAGLEAGKGLPANFRHDDAAWVLAGASWQQLVAQQT
jgi:hypothetical protein